MNCRKYTITAVLSSELTDSGFKEYDVNYNFKALKYSMKRKGVKMMAVGNRIPKKLVIN